MKNIVCKESFIMSFLNNQNMSTNSRPRRVWPSHYNLPTDKEGWDYWRKMPAISQFCLAGMSGLEINSKKMASLSAEAVISLPMNHKIKLNVIQV